MKLYEIKNGYIGESYVRCYAWAHDERHALKMALERFKDEADNDPGGGYPEDYWTSLVARELFNDNDGPFVSAVSSSGFFFNGR